MPARLSILTSAHNGYVKGSIVSAGPANYDFGSAVTLPDWIVVTVNGVTYNELAAYRTPVDVRAAFTVDSSDLVNDVHTITLGVTTPGALAGITRANVEAFLESWGVTILSHTAGTVTFTMGVNDAVESNGFWGSDVSGVVFLETSYDQGTGKHVITANYAATAWNSNVVAHRAIVRGCDVLDNAAGILTFEVDRIDIRNEFLRVIGERVNDRVAKSRYAITEASVDQIVALGGTATVSRAQFLAALVDRNG